MRRSLVAVALLCAATACANDPAPPKARPAGLSKRTVTTTEQKGPATVTRTLPVFSGALAAEVNRRIRRSVDEGVNGYVSDGEADVKATIEVTGDVVVNDARTLQVVLGYYYFAEGAAHPTDSVGTVVLRRVDASPVLLTDVLAPLTPALKAALHEASAQAKHEGREDPAASLKPVLADWADWTAGAKGITFHFDDYQAGSHAAGLREIAVPWSVLKPWVRTEAYALLGP